MTTETTQLVQRIVEDEDAMQLLLAKLLENTSFIRDLTKKINEAVDDGVPLTATEIK